MAGGTVGENTATFLRLVSGEDGPVADYVVLNAAAALWVAGLSFFFFFCLCVCECVRACMCGNDHCVLHDLSV